MKNKRQGEILDYTLFGAELLLDHKSIIYLLKRSYSDEMVAISTILTDHQYETIPRQGIMMWNDSEVTFLVDGIFKNYAKFGHVMTSDEEIDRFYERKLYNTILL